MFKSKASSFAFQSFFLNTVHSYLQIEDQTLVIQTTQRMLWRKVNMIFYNDNFTYFIMRITPPEALETISLVIPKYFITLTGKSLPSWNTLRKMKTALHGHHLLSP
jgi:hypothetical protein